MKHTVKIRLLLVIVTLTAQWFSCAAQAQGALVSFVRKVGALIDTMAVKGVDSRYIEAPARPWQVIVKGNVHQNIVSMKTDGTIGDVDYSAKPYLRTSLSKYVGLWVGYRGYGLGYTVNVGGDKGRNISIGATGGFYGINLRIHTFESSNPSFNLYTSLLTEEEKGAWNDLYLKDPINVRTVIVNGYYLFNGKKCSYSAAYDQSAIQKRSAGSLMAGLMYNYTRIDYASDSNCDLIYLMSGLGKVKHWQGSVGVGYAYNWVPARGLLVNVMGMPMLTFINKLRGYGYTTNMRELMDDPNYWREDIPADEWNQWYYEHARITPADNKTYNSGISLGFDVRTSLTYNFGRFYINAYGQFNNFRYHNDNTTGYLNDWFVNTSLGVRL